MYHVLEIRRIGTARPLLYPVAPRVRYAVKEFVEPWSEVNLILMGRTSVEPETGIAILLSVSGQLPDEFEDELRQVVLEACGEASTVRLFLLRDARDGAPGGPAAPPATRAGP